MAPVLASVTLITPSSSKVSVHSVRLPRLSRHNAELVYWTYAAGITVLSRGPGKTTFHSIV